MSTHPPKATLMTHIVAGYPDVPTSVDLLRVMDAEPAVEYIEIQIPFSDPVADGPTIMQACEQSLEAGMTPDGAFAIAAEVQGGMRAKLLFMTYYNVLLQYGLDAFCQRCQDLGLWGLIVPDIPIHEEATEQFFATCKKYNLHAVQVVSPITPLARLQAIAPYASGVVYAVSRAGVTGQQGALPAGTEAYLKQLHDVFHVPIALGFGIDTGADVQAALQHADIAVVGSSFIRAVDAGGIPAVEAKLRDLCG